MPIAPGLLVAVALVAAAAPVAPPRPISAEAGAAAAAFEEAAGRLQRARTALATLDAGGTPEAGGAPWSDAAAALQAAAEALGALAPPAVPDLAEVLVPLEAMRGCANRGGALGRADRGVRTLLVEAQRVAEARAWVRDRLAAAQGAEEARRALVKAAPRVQGDARLAAWFPWTWADLERPASGALAAGQASLKRWQDRLERGQAELRGRANDLAATAAEVARWRDCALAGRWAGLRTLEGSMSPVALKLVASGGGWSGSVAVDGREEAAQQVVVKGSKVTVTLADRKGSLTATLAADERTMRGTLSTADGLGQISLKRQ